MTKLLLPNSYQIANENVATKMTVFYEWLYFFTQLCLLDLLFVPVYHYDRRERKLAAAYMVSSFLALLFDAISTQKTPTT